MKILLIGPPGAGKGTQGARLAAQLGIEHIATGDLLRTEVEAQSEIGREISSLLDRGELVPDSIVFELVMPRIAAAAQSGGYLLDGFPRSVDQAVEARKLADQADAAPDAVIYLDVDRSELQRRILARAKTEGRTDDTPATVEKRLEVFEEATRPLVEYYRERGLLHVIDAAQDERAVTAAILAALDT